MNKGDGMGTPQEAEPEDKFFDTNGQQTGCTPTLSGPEWHEMQVLLELMYKNNQEANKSPMKHLTILHAMYERHSQGQTDHVRQQRMENQQRNMR